jgi:long-chain acyl-CoA synthetase
VAKKITAKLGGRLRLAICGGAPLSPTIARTFLGLGVQIIQGYGLTETSPVISVNREEDNEPASVGRALEGVEVRIGESDELLVRGPLVMLGYWHNEQATDATIDKDGWLHTGDKASIDERGHIFITGRIKEIIVMSNGEKVPPNDMELAIATDPLIEHVMVVGEGRPYLSALIVLNPEQWQQLCANLRIDAYAPRVLQEENVQQAVLARVCECIKSFPGYAQIQRIALTLEPWTVENGLITPTLKLKRERILQHYANEIEALYEGHASPNDLHVEPAKQTA